VGVKIDGSIVCCRHPCEVHASSLGVYQAPLSKLVVTNLKDIRDSIIVVTDVTFDIIVEMI
jgi:hypothetical protein